MQEKHFVFRAVGLLVNTFVGIAILVLIGLLLATFAPGALIFLYQYRLIIALLLLVAILSKLLGGSRGPRR
ncbi:hypothetical protein QYE77_14940 (plasmid) [Thermanaerothrix sp. 4228-RoL]|jgi:hypothetical protein|uniref:Uncharacterized protein n=1 Tax=Thermanaerothrix solaris TaxID=3058434 RepID=A0ABU3NRV9_9CHLR|nr:MULTISPECIES: hypothetical protein [unclassified Thermanaerothrix]MDT8899559.1 hypothetical protein [Thermanaerothrix sp. 4228-RoL]